MLYCKTKSKNEEEEVNRGWKALLWLKMKEEEPDNLSPLF